MIMNCDFQVIANQEMIYMYKMKEVSDMVGLSYEALRFYCNEGLVPNVRRDDNNHRIFDEYDVEWIKGTQCLRACGLCLEFEVPVTMNIFGDRHFFLFCSALSVTS